MLSRCRASTTVIRRLSGTAAVTTTRAKAAAAFVASPEDIHDAQPFSAIPGPLKLPFLYNFYSLPVDLMYRNGNELVMSWAKKYGRIFKLQYGPDMVTDSLVYLSDVDDIERLIRNDGLEPRRLVMESWQSWREESGFSKGIVIENDGPAWYRMRMLLNKQMLRPRDVSSYSPEILEVTHDFIERIRALREPDTKALGGLDKELFYWSLESIGTVIYETRFGGLSEDRTEEMSEFITAVHDMFYTTNYCFFLPRRLNQKVMPKMQARQDKAWEIIFKHGKKQIDNKFQEVQKAVEEGVEIRGFLTTLVASGKMSMNEIYGNVSELMAAAVDTTSNAMQWVIYVLAQNPDLQENVRRDIYEHVSDGRLATYDDLLRMTYMKGFIKEILRLYPVANVVSRISNTDLVLGGYHIPPNVRMVGNAWCVCRNPKYFSDPETIRPERWQRSQDQEKSHPYSTPAFGFGQRMCIGRRVAELEMYSLTSMLLQQYDLRPNDTKPNRPATRPILMPERPVQVRFLDRN